MTSEFMEASPCRCPPVGNIMADNNITCAAQCGKPRAACAAYEEPSMQTKLLIGGRLVAGRGQRRVGARCRQRHARSPRCRRRRRHRWTRRWRAADAAFPGWARTPPKDRPLLLTRIAERIEAEAADYAALESRQHRQAARPPMLNDELPAIADVFRFFAGACRAPQGLAAGEYLPGHTQHDPPRSGRASWPRSRRGTIR